MRESQPTNIKYASVKLNTLRFFWLQSPIIYSAPEAKPGPKEVLKDVEQALIDELLRYFTDGTELINPTSNGLVSTAGYQALPKEIDDGANDVGVRLKLRGMQ